MKIISLQVGEIQTNCYIPYDESTKDCAVIDPGGNPERIVAAIKSEGLTPRAILLTHGHFDHVDGLDGVRDEYDVPVYVHPWEKKGSDQYAMGHVDMSRPFQDIGEGDVIKAGSLEFKVLNTPGHTPGSCIFISGDTMFAGDTLFAGSCGRTDFPGGSWKQMLQSLRRLYELEGDYRVFPGHMGSTTLERERHTNPYIAEAVVDG